MDPILKMLLEKLQGDREALLARAKEALKGNDDPSGEEVLEAFKTAAKALAEEPDDDSATPPAPKADETPKADKLEDTLKAFAGVVEQSIEKALHKIPGKRKGSEGDFDGAPAVHKHGRGVSEEFSLHRMVKFQVTKDDSHLLAPERKAMSEGTTTAGGFLVPTEQSREIIDLIRAQSVVERSGARVIPLNSDRLEQPKLSTDPTLEWLGENAEATPSDAVLGQFVMTPKKAVTYTELSEELVMDSDPAVEDVLRNSIAQSQALGQDLKFLRGTTGGDHPVGILNTTGVQSYSLTNHVADGAIPIYDDFVNIQNLLEQANGMQGVWYFHARTKGRVRKIKDDDGNPIFISPMVGMQSDVPTLLGDPVWTTNQIPINLTVGASSDCSEIFYGDPRRLVIGRRAALVIEASKDAAFKKFQVAIRSMSRVDFGIETANQWVKCVHVR